MKLVDKEVVDFSTAIYKGECSNCGNDLELEYNSDADSPSWTTTCECGQFTGLYMSKVRVTTAFEKDDEDEE